MSECLLDNIVDIDFRYTTMRADAGLLDATSVSRSDATKSTMDTPCCRNVWNSCNSASSSGCGPEQHGYLLSGCLDGNSASGAVGADQSRKENTLTNQAATEETAPSAESTVLEKRDESSRPVTPPPPRTSS